jgi:hypothetical protein
LSGDGGQEDAIAGTDRTELLPDGKRDPLAARTGGDVTGKGVVGKEVKRANEGGRRVQKRNEVRPGDVLVRGGKVRRSKKDLVTNSGAVGRVNGVTMPLAPPTGTSVAGGAIARVTAVEVNSEGAAGTTVRGSRIEEAGININGDEVPARPEGALRKVLDEEHAVGAGEDSIVEV